MRKEIENELKTVKSIIEGIMENFHGFELEIKNLMHYRFQEKLLNEILATL